MTERSDGYLDVGRFGSVPTFSGNVIFSPAPPVRSKLRIVAGSDLITFNYPNLKPNWFVCLMTRLLLRMEWVSVDP